MLRSKFMRAILGGNSASRCSHSLEKARWHPPNGQADSDAVATDSGTQRWEGLTASEALNRKLRSEAILQAQGVPYIGHLPAIESSSEVTLRTKDEVAWRAMALVIVASKALGTLEGVETAPAKTREKAKEFGLGNHFTPVERAFMENDAPSRFELIQLSWRDEAACTLFWALGYIDELKIPTEQQDFWAAVRLMYDRTAAAFLRDASLRPIDEILDQADLIYRYHWAARDRGQEEQEPPAGLDRSVVKERHYALNWLIGYCNQPWDEVTTDT